MKLKNIETGPRGVYVGGDDEKKITGTMLVLEPGATSAEVDLSASQIEIAKRTGWFEFSGRGAPAKAADKD